MCSTVLCQVLTVTCSSVQYVLHYHHATPNKTCGPVLPGHPVLKAKRGCVLGTDRETSPVVSLTGLVPYIYSA